MPADRWFSDQIPADYLFGGRRPNPNGRLDLSASPLWTADISPYGSMGITSFNVNFTRRALVRADACRRGARDCGAPGPLGHLRMEPVVGPSPTRAIYDEEMALVEQYRPSLLAPFIWNAAARRSPSTASTARRSPTRSAI